MSIILKISASMSPALLLAMRDFALGHGVGVIRYPVQLFCHFQTVARDSVM
ncbi:MAG: hypothetical protein AB7V37_12895 [Eubacteriaceae bacterium]